MESLIRHKCFPSGGWAWQDRTTFHLAAAAEKQVALWPSESARTREILLGRYLSNNLDHDTHTCGTPTAPVREQSATSMVYYGCGSTRYHWSLELQSNEPTLGVLWRTYLFFMWTRLHMILRPLSVKSTYFCSQHLKGGRLVQKYKLSKLSKLTTFYPTHMFRLQ